MLHGWGGGRWAGGGDGGRAGGGLGAGAGALLLRSAPARPQPGALGSRLPAQSSRLPAPGTLRPPIGSAPAPPGPPPPPPARSLNPVVAAPPAAGGHRPVGGRAGCGRVPVSEHTARAGIRGSSEFWVGSGGGEGPRRTSPSWGRIEGLGRWRGAARDEAANARGRFFMILKGSLHRRKKGDLGLQPEGLKLDQEKDFPLSGKH